MSGVPGASKRGYSSTTARSQTRPANTRRRSSPKRKGCSRPYVNSSARRRARRCKALRYRSRARAAQHPSESLYAFPEVLQRARVSEAHVALGGVRPEIEPWCDGHARLLEDAERELSAVLRKTLAAGVDVEGSLGDQGDAKAKAAQCRHHVIAASTEFFPPLFEHSQRFGTERRQRRVLRRGGGTDESVLGELHDISDVGLRRDDPAQPPAGHAEIFGEAVHHEHVVGEIEHR